LCEHLDEEEPSPPAASPLPLRGKEALPTRRGLALACQAEAEAAA
jgi:hypothetical protein